MKNVFTLLLLFFAVATTSLGQTVSCGTITGSPFCPGSGISVPYTINGTFNAGNVFTAQLSDATGSFASAVSIGTVTAIDAGTINGQLPFVQTAGALYRIRVIASNPAINGADNGSDLVVTATNSPFTTHTKTWIGGTGNWNNPSNWSPCGVPNPASNIAIGTDAIVTIPTGFTAYSLRVQMSGASKLTVSANATLNSNGSQLNGIQLTDANTTLTNNGTINCGSLAPITVGGIGLFTGSKLENNVGATISINDIGSAVSGEGYGLVLSGASSFTNAGSVVIGNSKTISRTGISIFSSQLSNAATGTIEINRVTTLDGIVASGVGAVNNLGSIKIGNIAAVKQTGFNLASGFQFNNQVGGVIEINNITTGDAVSINVAGTSFTNAGSIKIGNLFAANRSGISLFNSAAFTNSSTGSIEIDNIKSTATNEGRGLALNTSSSFTNAGSLKIGKTTSIYRSCIFSSTGQFVNQSTGVVELNRTTLLDGISGNGTGSITNAGNIKIGNLASIGQSGINLNNGFQLVNQVSGSIEIDNVPVYPAVNEGGSTTLFNNSGSLKIGRQTTLSDGMVLGGGAKFTNQANALVEIDNTNGVTSGSLSLFGTASTFANAGTLNIGKYVSFSRRGIDLASGSIFNNQASGTVEIFSETVKDNNFSAANLTGTGTQYNNAGILKIRLKAPVIETHGLVATASSSFNNQEGSRVDLIINQ